MSESFLLHPCSIAACAIACALIFAALWVGYISYGLEMSLVALGPLCGLLWLWTVTVVAPLWVQAARILMDDPDA